MKTALWIIAICELIKLIVAVLGGYATAKMKAKEIEDKRRFTEQIREFNRYTESVKRMRDEKRRTNVNNTERD